MAPQYLDGQETPQMQARSSVPDSMPPISTTMAPDSQCQSAKDSDPSTVLYKPRKIPRLASLVGKQKYSTTASVWTKRLRTRAGQSPFLKILPPEIRNEIYGYLLISDILGDDIAIHPSMNFGQDMKYGLTPAILQTCRAIFDEAETILYNKNTFIVCLLGNNKTISYDSSLIGVPCPLTRYNPMANLARTPGFTKIRKWKVLLSCWAGKVNHNHPPRVIMDFCREACGLTIDHFSVSVIGHSGCKYWNKAATEQDCLMRVPHIIPSSLQPYPLNEVLSPFRQLLRNVKEVKFDSSLTDAATRDLLDEAKLLLESKDPVVHVFKLYRNLLKYAQNFERCERFKACMATPDGVFRQRATDTPTSREIIYDWHDYGENWLKNADKLRNFSPFKNMAPHPVEHALELAKYASDDNDVEEFKKQRKRVLEYLEPQYQQIVSAAASMLDFVTEHRNLMDYETEEEHVRAEIMAKGNIFLKRCGRSFNRKLEGEVKAIAKLHRDFFDSFYKDHQREINLASVTKVANQRNWVRWKYHFDMATLNMNSQYEWIQKTRIRLFQDDLVNSDVGCDIVMDLMDVSEVKGLDPRWMLNWPKA